MCCLLAVPSWSAVHRDGPDQPAPQGYATVHGSICSSLSQLFRLHFTRIHAGPSLYVRALPWITNCRCWRTPSTGAWSTVWWRTRAPSGSPWRSSTTPGATSRCPPCRSWCRCRRSRRCTSPWPTTSTASTSAARGPRGRPRSTPSRHRRHRSALSVKING